MTQIVPITKAEPACYGVLCPAHEHCSRYHAAEGTPAVTIPTCTDEAGARPLFVPLVPTEAPVKAGAA